MKNVKMLSILALLACFTISEVSAGTWVFFSYGHPLGLYSRVDQTFIGSNNFDDFVTVDCSGLGLQRCRYNSSIENPIDPDTYNAVSATMEEIQTNVENAIGNGTESDEGSSTVVRINADDSRTTFVIQWNFVFNPETEETELKIHIEQYEGLL
jgi:hypothetical protein